MFGWKRDPGTICVVAQEPLHLRCMSSIYVFEEAKCARGISHYNDEDQQDILVFEW
jgi:hypothetical protein